MMMGSVANAQPNAHDGSNYALQLQSIRKRHRSNRCRAMTFTNCVEGVQQPLKGTWAISVARGPVNRARGG